MANKKLAYILLISSFFYISCNSLKKNNTQLNNRIEFQYEKNGTLKRGFNYISNENDNFELIFLNKFNDSVYISNCIDTLFSDKIITNEITDNPNIEFLLNVRKYKDDLINISIPAKNVNESFYLSDKYKYIYIFYYEEKLIVRYSNKIYY